MTLVSHEFTLHTVIKFSSNSGLAAILRETGFPRRHCQWVDFARKPTSRLTRTSQATQAVAGRLAASVCRRISIEYELLCVKFPTGSFPYEDAGSLPHAPK